MSVASAFDRAPALQELPILPRTINDRTITDLVCAPLMGPAGRRWWIAFLICSAGTLVTLYGVYTPFTEGIGIFGNNTSVVWGFPIANYVWWIGLGNAGTLISSLLVLTRQSWRATVSRFAEAMTLFAVPIAGLFPIFHLGRPLYFYWLAPYPDTMRIWPQWRSALVWDFWAIVSYLIFSIVFWYVGVLPDLANGARPLDRSMAKDLRSRGPRLARLRQTLATLPPAADHTRGSGDAARLLGPFRRRPRFRREPDAWLARADFPAYFVVGAMYSGFALVVLLAATITRAFGLQGLITVRHFEAKIMLMASIVMGLSYLSEYFAAWYGAIRPIATSSSSSSPALTGSFMRPCCSATWSRRRFSGRRGCARVSP